MIMKECVWKTLDQTLPAVAEMDSVELYVKLTSTSVNQVFARTEEHVLRALDPQPHAAVHKASSAKTVAPHWKVRFSS